MRAATMKERPAFPLMRQTDVQSVYHMQMPRWLFSDPRYADMSLDAKVTYTFLLNRFQLSRRNGWVNDQGEVFVIFPRKALAKELRICEKRVTAAFRKLVELELVWEKRCGRGDANQIYLAVVEPQAEQSYTCAPFVEEEAPECGFRTADLEVLEGMAGQQEAQDRRFQNSQDGVSRTADAAPLEPQDVPPSYKEKSQKIFSHIDVSQSVPAWETDRQAEREEEELMEILDRGEMFCLEPETARVFENAIERLFYSDSFRIGEATLPQKRVRAKLHQLNGMILMDAQQKLHANLEHNIRNSTAYTMATIFNCIAESESDLMVDPYLNSLRAPPGR